MRVDHVRVFINVNDVINYSMYFSQRKEPGLFAETRQIVNIVRSFWMNINVAIDLSMKHQLMELLYDSKYT